MLYLSEIRKRGNFKDIIIKCSRRILKIGFLFFFYFFPFNSKNGICESNYHSGTFMFKDCFEEAGNVQNMHLGFIRKENN